MGDVFDDVEGVGLPHGDWDLHVLLDRHMDLLDHFVRPVNRDVHFLDDLEWDLFDNFIRDWSLDMHMLGLVHGVGNVLHDIDMDRVGLGHWYLYLLPNRHWDGMGHSNLDVTGHLNRDTANNILYDRLKLVSCSGNVWTTNRYSSTNHTWAS